MPRSGRRLLNTEKMMFYVTKDFPQQVECSAVNHSLFAYLGCVTDLMFASFPFSLHPPVASAVIFSYQCASILIEFMTDVLDQ